MEGGGGNAGGWFPCLGAGRRNFGLPPFGGKVFFCPFPLFFNEAGFLKAAKLCFHVGDGFNMFGQAGTVLIVEERTPRNVGGCQQSAAGAVGELVAKSLL